MRKNTLIVSGGDSKYFRLLCEQADSIRRLPNGNKINLAYLDGGLTPKEFLFLEKKNIDIVDPGWRHPIAEKRCRGKNYLKIKISMMDMNDSEIEKSLRFSMLNK